MSTRADAVQTFSGPSDLAEGAAREVVRSMKNALERRGVCTLVLAGGSTPRRLYERLASEPYRSQVDWSRIELFWGDERCVPPEHPASNYGMARDALLCRIPVPEDAVHRIQGELEPARAAAVYESEVRRVTGGRVPRFDVILLGMGSDGHTASLFPDTPDLPSESRLVVTTVSPQPPRDRVTLTLRTINAARKVMFLVQGEDKASVLSRVLRRDPAPGTASLPAALVRPRRGRVLWLLDRGAASALAGQVRMGI